MHKLIIETRVLPNFVSLRTADSDTHRAQTESFVVSTARAATVHATDRTLGSHVRQEDVGALMADPYLRRLHSCLSLTA